MQKGGLIQEVSQLSGRYVLYAVPQGAAFFMENQINIERFVKATKALIVNTLVNDYAIERVAFGYEQPGSQAPIDLYLDHLHLDINDGLHKRRDIPGIYIDEDERISTEQDYSEYVRDLFVTQMESIFIDAPTDKRLERAGEEIPLSARFRDYLFGLLPLFTEILNVKVEYTPFDVIPTDKTIYVAEYPQWQKFVTAILLKPLRSGSQVNRYVKDIKNAPYYIRRLIEKRGKNFYLKTADTESVDYIFALFSLMRFMNGENGKILELKMREWERLHKSE